MHPNVQFRLGPYISPPPGRSDMEVRPAAGQLDESKRIDIWWTEPSGTSLKYFIWDADILGYSVLCETYSLRIYLSWA